MGSASSQIRRRGVTIAAAALSVSMVATFAQPVAAPNALPIAAAQEAGEGTPDENTNPPAENTDGGNTPASDIQEPIWVDGYENGYVTSQTDMTNAQSTLSGRAYVLDNWNLGSTATGNSPVPEGTTVYMQWIDRDGAVSPVYATKTHDNMGGGDGAQNGPGAYVFDLREPWVDLAGNERTYTASNGQSYRLWIEPYEDPITGTTLEPFRQHGGIFPGAFRNSAGADQSGTFNLIGTNMQRTAVFMAPSSDYGAQHLALPEDQWTRDEEGPLRNPAVSTNARHSVSGRVWLENRDVRLDGPAKGGTDPAAPDYEVVMSTLTPEGISAYAEQVERLPERNQTEAAINLLRDNPDYIAATVVGKTDENGYYTLRFPEKPGTGQTLTNQSRDYLYGFVRDRSGNIVKAYSPFTRSTYEKPNSAISFTPQAVPASNPVQNPMWYNLHFAVVPYLNPSLEITNFDMVEKPGYAGQTAEIEVTGQLSDLLSNKIEWTKEDGTVLKTCENLTSLAEANACTFEIPEDVEDGEIITATLWVGENAIAADSFIVKKLAEDLVPNYEDGTVQQGREETIPAPTFDNERTDEQETEPAPEGTTFAPVRHEGGDEPANNPDWAEVDPNTGAITIKPGADVPVGDYEVWVEVTYPDGSKDKTSVPVTVTENTPDNEAFDPSYEPTNVNVGESGTTNDPFENAEEAAPVKTASTKEGFEADGWTFEVDPNTAVITGTAPSLEDLTERFNELPEDQKGDLTNVAEGLGEDLLNPTVPVVITYGDDTTDETNADFQLVGKDGNPITDPNGDFDGDGVSNGEEVEGGSNPFDENDTPEEEPPAPVIPDPVAKEIVTPRGEVPSAESGIENAGDFPEGTTFEWKEQPNVEQPGPTSGTVVVNVPGQDEPKEVNVSITVQSDADVFNPTPQDVSTNVGVLPNSDDGIANLTDLPENTTTEWVTEPDVSAPGDVSADIKVNYPDGSNETVNVTVKVNDPTDDAGKFDPSYDPTNVNVGESGTTNDPFAGAEDAEVKGANVQDGFQADGWTFEVDPTTAIVTGTAPGLDVLAGRFDGLTDEQKRDLTLVGQELNDILNPNVPVNITYGDDSSETGNAPFQLVGQDGKPITDPDGDFDGDGVSNGDEIEGGSNPFDETSTPEPSTPVDENPPLIDPVDTDDREITGTGDPGEVITVTLPDGTEITADVDDEGNWTVEVPEDTELNPGGTVSANDGNGNKTEITVTGEPSTPVDENPPLIDPVDTNDREITGTGDPGEVITVTLPDGTEITAEVDDEGNWTVEVPEGTELNPGGTVSANDGNGNKTEITVTGEPSTPVDENPPLIDPVDTDDREITGTGDPGEVITVTLPDGTEITADVDDEGNWTVEVPEGTELNPGGTVSANDGNGNKTEITVTGEGSDDADQNPPLINPVDTDDREITGTGEPGEEITVTLPDGTEITTEVDDEGNWTVEVPEGTELNPGGTVSANDGNGNKTEITVTGTDTDNGSSAGSVDILRCGSSIGISLLPLLLIPGALVGEVFRPQIQEINNRIQQQLGFFNPELARLANEYRHVFQGIAGFTAVLTSIGLIANAVNACSPAEGGSSSSSNNEDEGSSANGGGTGSSIEGGSSSSFSAGSSFGSSLGSSSSS